MRLLLPHVCMQESLDREQLKLGQHLRQEIKARKAGEKTLNDSLAAAAAAAAADLAALAGKTDASVMRLREKCEGLLAQQKRAQEQQAGLVGDCAALQQVRESTTQPVFGRVGYAQGPRSCTPIAQTASLNNSCMTVGFWYAAPCVVTPCIATAPSVQTLLEACMCCCPVGSQGAAAPGAGCHLSTDHQPVTGGCTVAAAA